MNSSNEEERLLPASSYRNSEKAKRIRRMGHRAYVGGGAPEMWYGIGRLQYHFLVTQGLRHHHDFLDVACGSLRLGQYLIPFLDRGRYFGQEAEQELVKLGLEYEFEPTVIKIKQPRFGYGYEFDYSFCPGFDYAMAQSLFTHFNASDIRMCLSALSKYAKKESRLYFTFLRGVSTTHAKAESDPHKRFEYSFEEIEELAGEHWTLRDIGHWNHPRGQQMVEARPC